MLIMEEEVKNSAYVKDPDNRFEEQARKEIQLFEKESGRRPRLLLVDCGGSFLETAVFLAQIGFDVDLCPAGKSPSEVAEIAAINDVHAVVVVGDDRDKLSRLLDPDGAEGLKKMVLIGGNRLDPPGSRDCGADILVINQRGLQTAISDLIKYLVFP